MSPLVRGTGDALRPTPTAKTRPHTRRSTLDHRSCAAQLASPRPARSPSVGAPLSSSTGIIPTGACCGTAPPHHSLPASRAGNCNPALLLPTTYSVLGPYTVTADTPLARTRTPLLPGPLAPWASEQTRPRQTALYCIAPAYHRRSSWRRTLLRAPVRCVLAAHRLHIAPLSTEEPGLTLSSLVVRATGSGGGIGKLRRA